MAREGMRSMFDNLKSRLTGKRARDDEYYDDAEYDDYDEDYEDYAEYDDYEERDRYASRSDRSYGDRSEQFAAAMDERYSQAVTTRPSRPGSAPRLVSIDDVRANTRVYGSDRPYDSGVIERASATRAASTVTPVGTAASAPGGGLDALFSSTSGGETQRLEGFEEPLEPVMPQTRRFGTSRSLEVVRPLSYNEAERVAKGLKAGDAVVLSLKNTPDDLAVRLVDFAFGVACALDATVERLAPKVYALTRASDLNDAERSMLRNQGVI